MKTSIIISSFAALCIMITLAEAPSHRSNSDSGLANELTYLPSNTVVTVTAKNISLNRKKESVNIPATPGTEDFSYLKFNVEAYMEPDSNTPDETATLPEKPETDFQYLKFNVNAYQGNDMDLTANETDLAGIGTSNPKTNEFSYLKFNVSNFIDNSESNGYTEFEELPLKETNSDTELNTASISSKINLKFNVSKYYPEDETTKSELNELPAAE